MQGNHSLSVPYDFLMTPRACMSNFMIMLFLFSSLVKLERMILHLRAPCA